jgi:hypothetical protein
MRKQVVKIVSWLMLVVFLIGTAPKEYLHHLLYTHTDTVDPVYKKGEFVISKAHIHCSFLGFVFAPFVASEKQFITFKTEGCMTQYQLPSYYYLYSSTHRVVSLRGPPADLATTA